MNAAPPPLAAPPSTPLAPAALVGLALLGVPRVILHDLGVLHEGTAVNDVFVVVPPLVWISVVLARRVPRPFLTLLCVGVLYGVLLALTHQLLWSTAFAGAPPALGGNLADLDPTVQAIVVRSFAALSSLVTGTGVGAVCGLLAALLSRPLAAARRRRRPGPRPDRSVAGDRSTPR
ncbi:hypothetical protein ACT3SP_15105 [Brachybacterium sp. AOP43-C2-M15]|uniref:hypothetical protein n=1 Tax=Brachybacterium sp. AOP43-C2-M15 TaxID=3457661 RepID=UPI00403361AA